MESPYTPGRSCRPRGPSGWASPGTGLFQPHPQPATVPRSRGLITLDEVGPSLSPPPSQEGPGPFRGCYSSG